MLPESTESLLLGKVEPLCLKPVSHQQFSRSYRCVITKANTSISQIISEFLAFLAEHW